VRENRLQEGLCFPAYVRAAYLSHRMLLAWEKRNRNDSCNFLKICTFNMALTVKSNKIYLENICLKKKNLKE